MMRLLFTRFFFFASVCFRCRNSFSHSESSAALKRRTGDAWREGVDEEDDGLGRKDFDSLSGLPPPPPSELRPRSRCPPPCSLQVRKREEEEKQRAKAPSQTY